MPAKRQKQFERPVPVQMDSELLAKITELAERMGEPQSTIMRMAMRLGIPHVEKEIDRLKRMGEVRPPRTSGYPPHIPQPHVTEETVHSHSFAADTGDALPPPRKKAAPGSRARKDADEPPEISARRRKAV